MACGTREVYAREYECHCLSSTGEKGQPVTMQPSCIPTSRLAIGDTSRPQMSTGRELFDEKLLEPLRMPGRIAGGTALA